MRVALVSEHASPLASLGGADAGGQNVHVAALAAGLARRGHQVTVFTRRDSVSLPDRVDTDDGYVVEHVPAGPPSDVPKDELLQYMPRFGSYLTQRLQDDPVDLLHAHFWMSGLAALTASRRTGTPVVQTFHALGSVKRRHQGAKDTSPPGRVEREAYLCRHVDHVIATCSDEVAELSRLGLPEDHATVIPCGVDTAVFTPGTSSWEEPAGPPRVLVIGRLVERKGIGNAMEAVAQLPGVELLVAGGPPGEAMAADPEVDRLTRLAVRLGLADRVRFLGSVGRRQVPELMRECHVVVCAPWYEPFGIVPLEAMACGRPLVGTAVGGLLDTVDPGVTGDLVPPRNPAALASALRALLDDPDRRRRYGRAGRRRALEKYRWEAVTAATEVVYAGVVERATVGAGVTR